VPQSCSFIIPWEAHRELRAYSSKAAALGKLSSPDGASGTCTAISLESCRRPHALVSSEGSCQPPSRRNVLAFAQPDSCMTRLTRKHMKLASHHAFRDRYTFNHALATQPKSPVLHSDTRESLSERKIVPEDVSLGLLINTLQPRVDARGKLAQ